MQTTDASKIDQAICCRRESSGSGRGGGWGGGGGEGFFSFCPNRSFQNVTTWDPERALPSVFRSEQSLHGAMQGSALHQTPRSEAWAAVCLLCVTGHGLDPSRGRGMHLEVSVGSPDQKNRGFPILWGHFELQTNAAAPMDPAMFESANL